ncbi:Reverse transcriptase domain-containing protein [Aphis craccivora]|uniref:Reverse transcriptase domain-containing protein n=1 Tax=Aphis craccivora TaxID=307492 RepID=A0A6G0YA30_APHCR|nr:Reverse transcriptase domain-containing protein [Aphis craccivora]
MQRTLLRSCHTELENRKLNGETNLEIFLRQWCTSSRSSLTKSVSGQPVRRFYQNCRGLRFKLVILRCNTAAALEHIFIILSETWLTNGIFNNELGLYNYNIFRCDRSSLSSNCSLKGGVLIGIRKDIPSLISYNRL